MACPGQTIRIGSGLDMFPPARVSKPFFVKGDIIQILKFEDHEAPWPLYRQHVMYACL